VKVGAAYGHVTPTIFGSTVGYPSDSLASCLKIFWAAFAGNNFGEDVNVLLQFLLTFTVGGVTQRGVDWQAKVAHRPDTRTSSSSSLMHMVFFLERPIGPSGDSAYGDVQAPYRLETETANLLLQQVQYNICNNS